MYTTEFCCCKLKPHSYFLMVNLIIMAVLGSLLTTINIDLLYGKRSLVIIIFEVILMITGIVFLVITVMAFFYFVIWDTIHDPFIRFFAKVSFLSVIKCLVFSVVIMLITIFQSSDKSQLFTFHVLGRWIWSIIFLSLLIAWTLKLIGLVEQSVPLEQKIDLLSKDIEVPSEPQAIKQISQIPGPEFELAEPREFNGNQVTETKQSLNQSKNKSLVAGPQSRNQSMLKETINPRPMANVAEDNLIVETTEADQ